MNRSWLLLATLPLLACQTKVGVDLDDTGDGGAGGDGGDGGVNVHALEVELTSPAEGAWYLVGDPLTVEVLVLDPAGGSVDGLALWWSGAVVDTDILPATTDADGRASLELQDALPLGLHSLGVQAIRSDGATGVASVAFEIVDPDKDLDGFIDSTYGGDDCNDEDPTINPEGEEFCDGLDNDCDGFADEEDAVDILTWYEDLDEDGFGKSDVVLLDCDQPKDFVLLDNDCDDSNPAINPLAAEVCDDVDNDCDGLTDDEDPGLGTASASAWFPDDDGDGFGDYSEYTLACDAPLGWVAEGGDCDDDNAGINPDALEFCDGRDNNCMDGVDEDTAVDAIEWYVDEDMDDWGIEDSFVRACDRPEGGTDQAGDCDDSNPDVNPGAEEVCNDGADTNCDGVWYGCTGDLLSTDALLLGENSLDEAGYSADPLGDIDGDGYVDLAVGARSRDSDLSDAGAVYVLLGPVVGEVELADAWATWEGEVADGRAGRALDGGPDVDGDGVPDLLLSAPNYSDSSSAIGAAYILTAGQLVDGGSTDMSNAWHRWLGPQAFAYLGVQVHLTDIDGDDAGDALLGATSVDTNGNNAGAAYLYWGPIAQGETDLRDGDWDTRFLGESASDQMGDRFDADGDLDGDGIGDVIFGVSRSSASAASAGAVYIVADVPDGDLDLADADARLHGVASGDQLGAFVHAAGDHDGDGRDDLMAGAPGNDEVGLGAGVAYLVHGRADLSSFDGQAIGDVADLVVLGSDSGTALGAEGIGDGDHDGDGELDLVIGAPWESAGSALLFLGPLTGTVSAEDADAAWTGDATTDGVGQLLSYGGNLVDGDADAIVVAARAADIAGTDAGALMIVGSSGL